MTDNSKLLIECPKTKKIKFADNCFRCDNLNYVSSHDNTLSCKPDGENSIYKKLIEPKNLE